MVGEVFRPDIAGLLVIALFVEISCDINHGHFGARLGQPKEKVNELFMVWADDSRAEEMGITTHAEALWSEVVRHTAVGENIHNFFDTASDLIERTVEFADTYAESIR